MRKRKITTIISIKSKEMEKAKQTILILRQNLMEIVTFVVAMVTKNLIATRRKERKRIKEIREIKMQGTTKERRKYKLVLLLLFTPYLAFFHLIGLLTQDALITFALKKINLKIFISIKRMQL